MTNHPSAATLNAFADGELSAEEAAVARQHVEDCLPCAASLINTWLLKTSIAKAGHRYAPPDAVEERMRKAIAAEPLSSAAPGIAATRARRDWMIISAWVAAAVMVLVLLGWNLILLRGERSGAEITSVAAEASDLHIAMLASSAPPQVVSSDRHTVKPWFQGKLPFSFNLPDALPADTHLDGANLAYLGDQPVAQLLFSIGRHRASVFVEQKKNADWSRMITTAHAGFRVIALETGGLELVAVSDAEPSRILALATAVRDAQSQP